MRNSPIAARSRPPGEIGPGGGRGQHQTRPPRPQGEVHSHRRPSGSRREARLKEGLRPSQGPTAGFCKEPPPGGDAKATLQPRAHSKSRPLLLCTSRSKGYPRRGPGYRRERGNCGEACGAPKGGFNCLKGRERKPRHPLPRGVCPTEGGETRRSVGVSRGRCPWEGLTFPRAGQSPPGRCRGPRRPGGLSPWRRPPQSLLQGSPYPLRRPGLPCFLGSSARTAHSQGGAGQPAGLGLPSQ